MQDDYDLLIVGGGLAGNCLALSLQDTGLRVAIVEATARDRRRASPAGDRALALARGTVMILEDLGIWQGVDSAATAIKYIHVSDQGHFGKTRLSAGQEGVAALGYVITARYLEEHVADLLERAWIEQICPARVTGLISGDHEARIQLTLEDTVLDLSARLVVGADGGNSSVRKLLDITQRKTEYGQTAIVTTVKTVLDHGCTAYERFTSSGPLAMLPVHDEQHCAVVWTRSHADAQQLLKMEDAAFMERLQQCFGYRLGELTLAAPRRAFPLTLIRADKMFAGRSVIVGNAADQLHPVAGQGFNLGLRDVVQLAGMLKQRRQQGQDIGAPGFLADYAARRVRDHGRVIGFTDNIVRLFSNDWLPLAAARNVGLTLLDSLPVAKSYLARNAMGLVAGRTSR